MAVSSVGTTTRIDEEGLASGKRDAVQPELNKDGKPLPPNNDGNTEKREGEADKIAAEKKIKAGKAVQGTGIAMTTTAGMMASAATIAAPVFPIGTITAAAVYIASAIVGIVGAITTFVGNRIMHGGKKALQDSLSTIAKGAEKSHSAAKNIKESSREGRRKSFVKGKSKHEADLKATRDRIKVLEAKGELSSKGQRQLDSLKRDETRSLNQFNKHDRALVALDASDTAVGTEMMAGDNYGNKPAVDTPYNRSGVDEANESALADAGDVSKDGGAGMNTSSPDAAPQASAIA
jgi:hypothetical protein